MCIVLLTTGTLTVQMTLESSVEYKDLIWLDNEPLHLTASFKKNLENFFSTLLHVINSTDCELIDTALFLHVVLTDLYYFYPDTLSPNRIVCSLCRRR